MVSERSRLVVNQNIRKKQDDDRKRSDEGEEKKKLMNVLEKVAKTKTTTNKQR